MDWGNVEAAPARARQLAARRRRAFVVVSFVLCLAYADLFTSGLGCTSNSKETDGGPGGPNPDLSAELIDASGGSMSDLSAELPDVTVSEAAVVDSTTSEDVQVADVTVQDSPSSDSPVLEYDAGISPDGGVRLLPDAAVGRPDAGPGAGLDGGWECTDESDCPRTGGSGYGFTCCLPASGPATCVAVVNGGETPAGCGSQLCTGPTDYGCPYESPNIEPCVALDASAPRSGGTVPLYYCDSTPAAAGH